MNTNVIKHMEYYYIFKEILREVQKRGLIHDLRLIILKFNLKMGKISYFL